MKKARLLLTVLFAAMAVSACSVSPTAPDCEDPTQCQIDPGSNN